MCTIGRKSILGLVLLLVIFLQGMTPFLHAHTGLSSRTGLHTPDASIGHAQVHKNTSVELNSKLDDESYVVQVGSGLSNEYEKLTLSHILVRNVFWCVTKPNLTSFVTSFQSESIRVLLSFYRSEAHPPPSLAPPAQHS